MIHQVTTHHVQFISVARLGVGFAKLGGHSMPQYHTATLWIKRGIASNLKNLSNMTLYFILIKI